MIEIFELSTMSIYALVTLLTLVLVWFNAKNMKLLAPCLLPLLVGVFVPLPKLIVILMPVVALLVIVNFRDTSSSVATLQASDA